VKDGERRRWSIVPNGAGRTLRSLSVLKRVGRSVRDRRSLGRIVRTRSRVDSFCLAAGSRLRRLRRDRLA